MFSISACGRNPCPLCPGIRPQLRGTKASPTLCASNLPWFSGALVRVAASLISAWQASMDSKSGQPRATAICGGSEGLKSTRCGAMSAQRGCLFPVHTEGSWGLTASLSMWPPDAASSPVSAELPTIALVPSGAPGLVGFWGPSLNGECLDLSSRPGNTLEAGQHPFP